MLKNIITKPIQAVVLALVLIFLGIIGMGKLSVTRFPEIAPPSVQVKVNYPGASSETVAEAVLIPIEEAINGVDGMTFIESRASNSGTGVINIYFETGSDPDQASVSVQTRVSEVSSEIPIEVVESGISVTPRQRGSIMTINLFSEREDEAYDETFLQAYALLNVNREILRVPGVAKVSRIGQRNYSMRIWLNPEKIAAYGLTPQEVMQAVEEQNFEIAPGKFGEASDKVFEIPLRHKGRFSLPEEYENIAIRTNPDRSLLFLKDIARVEFGASNIGSDNSVNGMPGLTLTLTQTAGSNANVIDENVRKVLKRISKSFPPGIKYEISYSVKEQIDASISQVQHTIIEAFILVFIIVFIFLQNFRSTLIPVIAIPVTLMGTFFFIYLLGFSINVLTMFALVLAIGIVVDDAIIVVEAIYERMHDTGMTAKKATLETMREIKGAILSITMVMAAVFLPAGFMQVQAGIFYQQFAYTLAIAILLSAINALTFTPALCALFLRRDHSIQKKLKFKQKRTPRFIRKLEISKKRFFKKFNRYFDQFTHFYVKVVQAMLKRTPLSLAAMLGVILLGVGLMMRTPTSFIPTEDDSFLTYSITMPPGASLARTKLVLAQADSILKDRPEIAGMTNISGYNAIDAATSPSFAVGYINLKPYKERGKIKNINDIINLYQQELNKLNEGKFSVFPRPTVQGFGDFSGVEFVLQDRLNAGFDKFDIAAQDLIKELNNRKEISNTFTSFNANFPQYALDIDYIKAKALGVNIRDLMNTIRAYYGRVQAGDFSRFGRQYRVYMQADVDFRNAPESFNSIFVKNNKGEMLPANTLVKLRKMYGPETVNRYNLFNAISIKAMPADGYSTGDAIKVIEEVSQELPGNYAYEFTGMTLEEKSSGNQSLYIFGISILFVYFLLAAQYESFLLPLAILLSVPTGFLGVYGFINLAGLENNIYVQVGLIMLIGLLAKNAILIVEFALQRRKKGMQIIQAAAEGARMRLRPILMTSFAFIAGLIPLMFTVGPSAIGNHSISISAAGGMLIGVICGIFFIPVLFYVFQTFDERLKSKVTYEEE